MSTCPVVRHGSNCTLPCGYIAADATCALRLAALAACNSWIEVGLRNYASLECVRRGNQALGKEDKDRVLFGDDINFLVRHYSGLDQRRQAAEEWYAGAVALDHFLEGLPEAIRELHDTTIAHKWRAWIVNTQASMQEGSHWFTVVAGSRLNAAEALASRPAAEQSHARGHPLVDGHEPNDVAESLLLQPAAEQSLARGLASADGHRRNDYPAFF